MVCIAARLGAIVLSTTPVTASIILVMSMVVDPVILDSDLESSPSCDREDGFRGLAAAPDAVLLTVPGHS